MYVKINKSIGLIEYDDNSNCWEADIIFRTDVKDIVLLGTAHKLTSEEPILAETIIELPKNVEENKNITQLRSIYKYLKLAVEEALSDNKSVIDDIDYEFSGTYFEYRRYKTIIKNLLPDFEYYLTQMYGNKIKIEYTSKFKIKKGIFSFRIKEV